ncbi:hypothetical protein [Fulvivirga lutea]|uniref:Uncharacterized protein n=1 Tax=Fulvivirga lutea TaxID=2810512 RepID=A0A974WGG6_9BACT|nr:hypothetical protein [Fulvivirga lutea]QSE98069.1 hypothetical protein JR347_03020 [Fulvivirga lutea]
MIRLFSIIITMAIVSACSNKKEEICVPYDQSWSELNQELALSFGQLVTIESKINAVVVDVSKDEGGIWYGLCFYTDKGLFGRQIPNGMVFTTCTDMVDLTYLNESSLDIVQKGEILSISCFPYKIGSNTPAENKEDVIRSFEYGINRRKLQQTPCDEGIFDLNTVRECYFTLSSITGEGGNFE